MSTVTPLVVRMGRLTVRAALSSIFATLAVGAILVGCAKMAVVPLPKPAHGKPEKEGLGEPEPAFTGVAE